MKFLKILFMSILVSYVFVSSTYSDVSTKPVWAKSTAEGISTSKFQSIVKDSSGNSYAVGYVNGAGKYGFGNGVNINSSYANGSNIILVKYDNSGNAQWAKTVTAGPNNSQFSSVAIDSSGNIYAVGSIYGNGSYDFGNTITVSGTHSSGDNLVLVKYDNSGNTQWAKSVATGSNNSQFCSVAVDSTGNVYTVGSIYGNGSYDFGNSITVSGKYSSGNNIVLVKYNGNGDAQWAKSVTTGSNNSQFYSVAVDSSGTIYASGSMFGTGIYGLGNSITVKGTCSFDNNIVLVKYNSNGDAQWAKSVTTGAYSSQFYSVTVDSSGNNIYAAGYINGVGTYTFGAGVTVNGTSSYNNNIVLVKYDNSGNAQWAKSVTTGSNSSQFSSVTIDSTGNNIYAAGYIYGNSTFTFGTGITVNGTCSFNNNIVLVKYDNSGNALWAKSVTAGSSRSEFYSVAIDSSESICAAGFIGSSTYNFGNSVSVAGRFTYYNLMLVKYDSTGNAQWAKSLDAGPSYSSFRSVTVDLSENAYAAGYISGSGIHKFGNGIAVNGTYLGFNVVLVKYDIGGDAKWAKSVTIGPSDSMFNSVATDSIGNIYAVGSISGANTYSFGNGVNVKGTYTTSANVVLVKYDSNGNAQWAKSITLGSNLSDFSSVAVDGSGNIYAVGHICGTGSYNFGNGVTVNGAYNSGCNIVLVKYDNSGNAQWAKSVATGSNSSEFRSVAIDPSGNAYVIGYISGSNAYTFGNNIAVNGTYGSGNNVLLVKYSTNGDAQWAKSVTKGSSSSEFQSVVVDSSGNAYATGHIYGTSNYTFGAGITVKGTYSSGDNILLVKYNTNGDVQWAKSVIAATIPIANHL